MSAALTAGVFDAAYVRQAVRGLVQERGERGTHLTVYSSSECHLKSYYMDIVTLRRTDVTRCAGTKSGHVAEVIHPRSPDEDRGSVSTWLMVALAAITTAKCIRCLHHFRSQAMRRTDVRGLVAS